MKNIDLNLLNNIYKDIKNCNKIKEKTLAQKYFYSERTIRRYIRLLKDKGLIALERKGKSRKWIILK